MRTEHIKRRALDISQVAYCDDHIIVGIEVFGVEITGHIVYLCAALVAVFVADLFEFTLDEIPADNIVAENELKTFDLFHNLVVGFMEFFLFESAESFELHIDNRLSLNVAEAESLFEPLARILIARSVADNVDNLVDVVAGNDKTFYDVGAFACFAKFEACAADNDFMAMVYEGLKYFL